MKIGFSVVDITPELGIYLTGYGMPERLAEGVHSPLNASVMVLEDEKNAAAVIGMDWCFVDWPLTQVIRKEINRQTGIPERNILLCCSHTHSAPHTTYMRTLGRTAVDPENKGVDYTVKSAPLIAAGVKEAQTNLRECIAGFAAAGAEAIHDDEGSWCLVHRKSSPPAVPAVTSLSRERGGVHGSPSIKITLGWQR